MSQLTVPVDESQDASRCLVRAKCPVNLAHDPVISLLFTFLFFVEV
jgi:hypothetical protein